MSKKNKNLLPYVNCVDETWITGEYIHINRKNRPHITTFSPMLEFTLGDFYCVVFIFFLLFFLNLVVDITTVTYNNVIKSRSPERSERDKRV